GFGGRDLSDLHIVFIDEENGRDSDLLVVAEIRRNGGNPPKKSPRPGRRLPSPGVQDLFYYRPGGRTNHAKIPVDLQDKIVRRAKTITRPSVIIAAHVRGYTAN